MDYFKLCICTKFYVLRFLSYPAFRQWHNKRLITRSLYTRTYDIVRKLMNVVNYFFSTYSWLQKLSCQLAYRGSTTLFVVHELYEQHSNSDVASSESCSCSSRISLVVRASIVSAWSNIEFFSHFPC